MYKNIDYCGKLKFKSCDYSNKLLDKIVLLNETAQVKVDINEIKKAICYAKEYHANQKRQSGEPYYSHPLEVAYMVADYLFRTDILVSSILHDTIEDTELTKEMVAQVFGDLVARQVEDLTRIKGDRKISSAEMIETLYQEKKHDILLIKLFDRLHNMQTITAKSPEKIKKIVLETASYFIILAPYFGISEIEQQFYQLCWGATHQEQLLHNTLLTNNLKGSFFTFLNHRFYNNIKSIFVI
ncbi:HD domain-containing protein [Rickettsia endosymbiont of Ixodes scapularis]|uniref:HD domain-containing protein n=1 Tax=Rickettsia endosymbiont of Ixodes scapularis TaxID=444612 RepID=UPI0001A60496|nr:HD domain-containing protein [Rickettsia endosymbiont of Ixodes scapularis]EER22268.1 guanosine polyphosphate pyrophosphohydrolase/synthetase [Rickettsia endosymbiont of Ixodes scapularis]